MLKTAEELQAELDFAKGQRAQVVAQIDFIDEQRPKLIAQVNFIDGRIATLEDVLKPGAEAPKEIGSQNEDENGT
jgi:hypothetical protein